MVTVSSFLIPLMRTNLTTSGSAISFLRLAWRRRRLRSAERFTTCPSGHRRCLLSDLPRVNDEFERVRVLMLLHQLEVDEPFGVSHGSAVREPASGRFKQRGGQFVFAVGGQALHGPDELFFRQTEVVNQEFCAVGPAEMVEALQVRLPIANVLVV